MNPLSKPDKTAQAKKNREDFPEITALLDKLREDFPNASVVWAQEGDKTIGKVPGDIK